MRPFSHGKEYEDFLKWGASTKDKLKKGVEAVEKAAEVVAEKEAEKKGAGGLGGEPVLYKAPPMPPIGHF